MRILHVIHGLPPERVGGAEVYTRHLAAAQAAAGHAVTIFAPAAALGAQMGLHSVVERASDGVTLVRTPLPPSRARENAAAQLWHTVRDRRVEAHFAALLRHTPFDVVHVQHVQGLSAELVRLAAQARIPARLLTLHDFWFFCANSQLRRPGDEPCAGPAPGCTNCVDCLTLRDDLRPLRRLRPLVALPLAARNRYLAARLAEIQQFIAPSAFLRDRYVEQGLDPARILVLENGIVAQTEGARPLQGSGSGPTFVFVGTLAPHKGVHVLIEAFNRLPAAANLLVVGGGEAAYTQRLAAVAAHPGIRFSGPQPQPVVHATLAAADALVVPSLWYENSPLVVQEAFAAGIPVLASNLGALPEKVTDGVNGRLFAPGRVDALATLLADLVAEPGQLAALRAGVRPPAPMAAHAARLLDLYAATRF